MDTITIKELQSQKEIPEAFPVMNQLRAYLNEAIYLDLVTEAKEKDMYKLVALYIRKKLSQSSALNL